MPSFHRFAFTLVELLATIVVVGLLIGLLVPAVSGGVVAARTAQCEAGARSFAQSVHTYAGNHRDRVPAMRVVYPDDKFSWDNTIPRVSYDRPDGGIGLVEYPIQGWFAGYVLSGAGYLGSDDAKCPTQNREQYSDNSVFGDETLPSYAIPEVFYFRTAVYERPDRWASFEASYRVQPLSSVQFPAEKVLIFERRSWHLPGKPTFFSTLKQGGEAVVAMADGSVLGFRLTGEAVTVYNSAFRYERPVPWVTPGGVGGSDLRP